MTKKQLEKLNAIDEEIGLLECDFWCAHFNAREAARKHKESSLAECLQDIEMVSQRIQELRNTRNLLEQKYITNTKSKSPCTSTERKSTLEA